MKTHATFPYFLSAITLAAILAMPAPNARAEDKQKPGSNSAEAAAPAPTYDIVIAHGILLHGSKKDPEPPTLGAAIEVLRKCQPGANIVLGPGLSDLPIGEVKLHAYNVVEVLQALRAASGDKFDWTMPGSPEPNVPGQPAPAIDPSTGLPSAPGAAPAQGSGLFVLREPVRTEQDWRVVEAFNIAPYLTAKKMAFRDTTENKGRQMGTEESRRVESGFVDELESLLIDTVARFREEAKQSLKFQYHQGATLLIVIGPKMDVEVVRKVMSALMTEQNTVKITEDSASITGTREALSVVAIPLKNASLTTAYSAATSLLEDKRSKVVVADERTKTLIISATKEEVSAIQKAIEQLEQAPKPYVGDFPAKEGKSAFQYR